MREKSPTLCNLVKNELSGGISRTIFLFSLTFSHSLQIVLYGFNAYRAFKSINIIKLISKYCVSFNRLNTYQWYNKRVYDVTTDSDYNPENVNKAFEKSLEWEDRIPLGIIYRSKRSPYEQKLTVLKTGPLIKKEQSIEKMKKPSKNLLLEQKTLRCL